MTNTVYGSEDVKLSKSKIESLIDYMLMVKSQVSFIMANYYNIQNFIYYMKVPTQTEKGHGNSEIIFQTTLKSSIDAAQSPDNSTRMLYAEKLKDVDTGVGAGVGFVTSAHFCSFSYPTQR